MKSYIITASICLATAATAFATPTMAPAYTTFGPLSGANFGGTGNPTDPVAITTISDSGNTITLGLAAQGRYANPQLSSAGGVYEATTGANDGLTTPGHALGATWNFDFYFDATGGSYHYQLSYGLLGGPLLTIDPAAMGDNKPTPNTGGQNSQNLLFPSWGNSTSSVLNSLLFDPTAPGVYVFELEAFDDAGAQVGTSDIINVAVRAVPDASSTAGLLGLGIIGLGLVQYRRSRLARVK
jgi:hypothetical protein